MIGTYWNKKRLVVRSANDGHSQGMMLWWGGDSGQCMGDHHFQIPVQSPPDPVSYLLFPPSPLFSLVLLFFLISSLAGYRNVEHCFAQSSFFSHALSRLQDHFWELTSSSVPCKHFLFVLLFSYHSNYFSLSVGNDTLYFCFFETGIQDRNARS